MSNTLNVPGADSVRDNMKNDAYNAERVSHLSNEEVSRILERLVCENIKAYYPELGKQPVVVTGKAWGGQETARTFRIEIRSEDSIFKKTLFVKLCPIFERINPSKLEYETLQLLYRRMSEIDGRCRVSRPIDFYPVLNAYAMESVGTNNFKTYLLKSNSRFRRNEQLEELFKVVGDCGAWLREFHEITKSGVKKRFSSTQWVQSINEDYDIDSLSKFTFSKTMLASLDRFIVRLGDLDHTYDMPCAKWHWDFTPGHVYLNENGISVIDITGIDDTPIFEDIGRFLAAMSAVNNIPRYPFYDHGRADADLCDVFMRTGRFAS